MVGSCVCSSSPPLGRMDADDQDEDWPPYPFPREDGGAAGIVGALSAVVVEKPCAPGASVPVSSTTGTPLKIALMIFSTSKKPFKSKSMMVVGAA
jgi:hypothetical protein